MLKIITNRIRSNDFIKNTLLLATGTSLAQIIPVLISPFLSRIYTPNEFGIFGTISTIAVVLSAMGAFRLELGIVLEKSKYISSLLMKLCICIVIGLSLFYGVILFFSTDLLNILDIDSEVSNYVVYSAIIFFCAALMNILFQYLNSEKKYRLYSSSQVLRAIFVSSIQLGTGILNFGVLGLIIGNIFGTFVAIGFIFKRVFTFKGDKFFLKHIRKSKILIKKYKNFAKYTAPQDLLNSISSQLPIFILGYFYGAEIVGLYWFGVRIIQLPSSFLGGAIRNVFYKEAADHENDIDSIQKLHRRITLTLISGVIPSIVVFFFTAPLLFDFIFGKEWIKAGEMAKWLFLWVGIAFCNIPTVQIFYILKLQKYLLIYEILLTTSRATVLIIGGIWLNVMNTIKLFTAVGVIFNIMLILLVFVYLKSKNGRGDVKCV